MKQSLVRVMVLSVLSFFLCSTAFGQFVLETANDTIFYEVFSFDFVGGGARAEGMGKAFLGVSDDITGGSWNPAGIYEHEKPVIGISWASLTPRGKSSTTLLSNILEQNHSGSSNTIGSFNFIAPIRIKGHPFVGSFNYTRNFDVFEQFDWTASSMEEFVFNFGLGEEYDTLLVEQEGRTEFNGGLRSVNFAFGTRLYKNFSFGGSVNVYSGSSVRELNRNTFVHDVRYYSIVQSGLYNNLYTVIDTNKFSGVNFTVGFKHNGDKLDVGLLVRTGFELKVKADSSIFNISKFNNLILDSGIDTTFIGTDTTFVGDVLTNYDIPWIFGVGFGYHLSDNFLVAADTEYRKFSGSKVRIRESITINPGSTNEETFLEIDPKWNNAFTFRLGTEYLWQTGIGEVPIRTGFGYIPVPAPNTSSDGNTSTAVNYNFSTGTGIHWEQIYFDVAYSYIFSDREPGSFSDIKNREYKNRNHHLNFSFTGIF